SFEQTDACRFSSLYVAVEDHDFVVVDARSLSANLLGDSVALPVESGLGGLECVSAVKESEELPLLRVLVVEDENGLHAFGRRHLARRHALIHELVELLRVPAFERGDPYPHVGPPSSMALSAKLAQRASRRTRWARSTIVWVLSVAPQVSRPARQC